MTQSEMPEILYHYTTWEGLRGIIESKSLWATNINFLNDRNEFRDSLRLLRNRIEEQDDSTRAVSNERPEPLIEVLSALSKNVYVASFSRNPDQLGQWRGYCTDDSAFSVGFNAGKIREQSKLVRSVSVLGECLYQEQQKIAAIDHIIAEAESPRDEWIKFLADLTSGMINVAPLCKDTSFEQEEEWRLALYIVGEDKTHIKFRDGRGVMIPYYEVKLQTGGEPLPISSVRIGPIANADEWEISLGILFAQHGIEATIDRSAVPYRPKM